MRRPNLNPSKDHPMRSMRSLLALLALTLVMLCAITAVVSGPQAASSANDELVLIASASNRGEVDPCG
jgi:type IV secretory pathway TrbL component